MYTSLLPLQPQIEADGKQTPAIHEKLKQHELEFFDCLSAAGRRAWSGLARHAILNFTTRQGDTFDALALSVIIRENGEQYHRI
jgi:hypothetical protein